MAITAIERAERAIGQAAVRRLEAEGLRIEYSRPEELSHFRSYPNGVKKIIGKVYVIDEKTYYPCVDVDPGGNGYELVYAQGAGRMYTMWVGRQNCMELEGV